MDLIRSTSFVADAPSALQAQSASEEDMKIISKSYLLTNEEARTYWQVKKDYEKEMGVDFASNFILKFHTVFVLYGLARTEYGRGDFLSDKAVAGYGSIADYLEDRAKEFGVRDEAWVKRVYSLTDSPDDLEFGAYHVESYNHLTAFIQRLIDAMPIGEKGEFSSRILSARKLDGTEGGSLVGSQPNEDVVDRYQEIKDRYQEENGVSFESEPLGTASAQILRVLSGVGSNLDNGDLGCAKRAVAIDYLRGIIDDMSDLDEEWVKRNYLITNETISNRAFVLKAVDGYMHFVEFIRQLIDTLQRDIDLRTARAPTFNRLLDIEA